jgi:hypothetical protein
METPNWLEPWVKLLPDEGQKFMNAGGWIVVAGLVVIILLGLALGLLRGLFARRAKAETRPELMENLAEYPPPPAQSADRQLRLYGLPVRLRLVVTAPLGYEASQVEAEVPELLDRIVPDLSQFLYADMPRVRAWPTQLSHQGFMASFRRYAVTPDEPHEPSRWVLVMGRVLMERRPIALGMAFLAGQENTLGRIVLDQPHQWMDALRVKVAEEI